jgi:hypothetical protein
MLLLLLIAQAPADTLTVGNNQSYLTIQAAVDDAEDGDVIEVLAGTYTESVEIDDLEIAIDGVGSDDVFVEAGGSVFEISSSEVTISNLTVQATGDRGFDVGESDLVLTNVVVVGGETSGLGAGMKISESTLEISGSTFEGGLAENEYGGQIAAQQTETEIFGSTFVDGSAAWGGAIWVDGGSLLVEDSTFDNTEANGSWGVEGWGGAIAAFDAAVDVAGCEFIETWSDEWNDGGGAIAVEDSELSVIDVTFDECEAGQNGGAIYAVSSVVTIEDVDIHDGSSGYNGGGVWVSDTELIISGGSMSDNRADASFTNGDSGYGGAVYATSGSTVTIEDMEFSENTVDNGGGAVYIRESVVTISGSTFADNTAPQGTFNSNSGYGGGAYFTDSEVEMSDCEFVNNHSDVVGGAIYTNAESVFTDVLIEGNDSEWGGGIYGRSGLELVEVTLTGNTASESGGGLRWRDDTESAELVIDTSVFEENVAADDGGGMALLIGGSVLVIDSEFTGNSSEDGAGADIDEIKEVLFNSNLFCGNTSSDDGGGVFVTNSGATDNFWTNNVFAENSAGDAGGGMLHQSAVGDPLLENNSFVSNSAGGHGGAFRARDNGFEFVNNLVAWSSGDGVSSNTTSSLALEYNNFYENLATDVGDQIDATFLGTGNLSDDPKLAAYSADGDCSNDQFWLNASSTLIDAGDPNITDKDGSVSDIGAYGGQSSPDIPSGDNDGDGFDASVDCDDNNEDVHPDADEECDGIDNDCDGDVDGALAPGAVDWYADSDKDGFGDANNVATACDAPNGYVEDDTDCDDGHDNVNPDADEECDGLDNDCDGKVDEGVSGQAPTWYADADGDGFGDGGATVEDCAQPAGYVVDNTDCDDSTDEIYPGAPEDCDGVDQDCNGVIDNDPVSGPTWFEDMDGDGYGGNGTVIACGQPSGFVDNDQDCNDDSDLFYPGAPEECTDVRDYNCDGLVGDFDNDNDGFLACEDCNDADAFVHPDAEEIWYDGVDDNCDGNDADQDGDGFDAREVEGGDDCDDLNPDVNPEAEDVLGDGFDTNCDGDDGTDDVVGGLSEELGVGDCGCSARTGSLWTAWPLLMLLGLRRSR